MKTFLNIASDTNLDREKAETELEEEDELLSQQQRKIFFFDTLNKYFGGNDKEVKIPRNLGQQ
jgi:hypothetical protein